MTRSVTLLIAGIASMLAGGAQADWIDTFAGGEPEQFWAFRYNPTNSGSVAYASGTSATMGSLTVTTGGTNWIGYGVVPTNSFAGTGVVVRSVVNPFGSTLAGPRVGVVAQVDPALGTGYLATIDTSATNGTSTLSLNKAVGSGGSTTSLGTATIPAFSATGKYTVELQVLGPLVNARVYDEFDTLVAQTSASDSSPYGSGFAGVGLWAGTSGTSAAPLQGTWGTTAAAGVAGPGGALIWAPNGGVPSGTAAVATGTWTTGAATWLSTTGTAPSAWNPTKTAYFGGTGLSSGGSVVVSGTSGVSVAAGMKFEVGGYRITGTSGGQIVLVSSTQQIDVGPQFTATISAPLSGTAGLEKVGMGTLVLDGSNSYGGGTRITRGTLIISSSAAVPRLATGGVSVAPDATLAVTNGVTNATVTDVLASGSIGNGAFGFDTSAGDRTYGAAISGSLSLVKLGGSSLTLTGTNTYAGLTTVSSGTLRIDGPAALPGSGTPGRFGVAPGAVLMVTNTVSDPTVVAMLATGNVRAGGFGFDTAAGDRAFSSSISGSLSLVKAGNNTLTLTGTNSYSGGSIVSTGTLRGSVTSLQGPITNNAAVVFDQATTGTYAGMMAGSGSLTKLGAAELTLTASNSYSGGTIVSTGTLRGNVTSLQGRITNNAAVVFDQATTGTYSGMMSGFGGLTKLGVGTLTLTGSNSYVGGTRISSGTLRGDSASLTGNIANSSALEFAQATSGTYGGSVSGTGSLVKSGSGTLTLSGTSTYTGQTWINEGSLVITSTTALPGSGTTGKLTVSSSAALVVGNGISNSVVNGIISGTSFGSGNFGFDTSAGDRAYSTPISGSMTLIKLGANQLTLQNFTGINTYAGARVVSGTLRGTTSSLVGTISIADSAAVLFDQSASGTFSGVVTGSGGLVKTGLGTLTLSGSNSYSGGTLVSAGTLLGNATSLQGPITNNTTVVFDQPTTGTYAGLMSGSGSLTKLGAGNLTLTGANTYSGTTQITAGVLALGSPGALGSAGAISFGGGTLQFSSSNQVDYSSRFSANQQYRIDTAGQSVSFGSPLTSPGGSLTKIGSGTLTLAAANTYGGTTRVAAGTLALSNTGALAGSTLDMNVDDSGSVAFAGSGATYTLGGLQGSRDLPIGSSSLTVGANGQSTDYSGVLSGSGSLTKTGAGKLTLAAANTHSGTTRAAAGTLALANTQALAGSTLDMKAGDLGSVAFAVSGTQTYKLGGLQGLRDLPIGSNSLVVGDNGQSTEYTGVFSGSGGSLTKSGTGILTLANSFSSGTSPSDATRVEAGALVWSATSAQTGTTTVASTAAFGLRASTLFNSGTIDALFKNEFPNVLMAPGASVAIDVNSGSFTYATNQDAQRGLLKVGAGTLTLTGSNTYSGGTVVSAGRLIGSTTSLQGAITNNAAVEFDQAIIGTYANIMSGTGSLTKSGTGTLTLAAENTYTGTTQVNAGVLALGASNVLSGSTTVAVAGGDFSTGTFSDTVGGFTITSGSLTGSGTLTAASYALGGGTVSGNLGTGSMTVTANSALNGTAGVTALNLNSGTLTLGTASRFTATGSIVVNGSSGGALVLGGNEAFGSLAGGADVALGGFTLTTGSANSNTSYAGALSGSGGLTKVGSGTFTLTGPNTYTGTTQVNAGRLIGSTSSLPGAITNNAAVEFAQATTGTFASVISGTGLLTKSGTGTLELTGANSYAGGTIVSAGSLLGNATSLRGPITNNASVVFNQTTTGTGTYAGIMSGSGLLTKSGTGTLELTGPNSYSGGTLVSVGTLLGNATSLPGTITNYASVVFNQTTTGTYSGIMAGTGSLTKIGTGTLTLSNTNYLTGSTTVQQGTLQLANEAALASSRIVPLAGGIVSLTPYLQTTVGGLAPNAGGLVNVGSGKVTVVSGLTATDLVTAIVAGRGDGSWTGTSGITSSVAAANVALSIPRAVGWLDDGDGYMTAAYAAPGDTNIDWRVDVLDAGNFLSFGKFDTELPSTWQEGDFNYDVVVDILDAADFFNTALYDTGSYNPPAGAAGSVAAVPEPSSGATVAITILVASWLVCRRRT